MRLTDLLREVPGISPAELPALDVTALTCDSRQVIPGALYVAVPGTTVDGHLVLGEAAAGGAAAAIGEQPVPDLPIPYFRVHDSRLALAHLAAAWHGHPARRLVMIGVTGTDGKTTTCNLIHRILLEAGVPAGMITTVNAVIGERLLDTGFHVTTPDAPAVQGYLAEMVGAGLTHCVLEATSHGLAQHRVAACDFDVGVITNITHEHLDYHGSFQAYRQAKALLFRHLGEGARKPGAPEPTAVLNADDESFDFLRQSTQARLISYGLGQQGMVRAEAVEMSAAGLRFRARGPGYQVEVASPLIGAYNVANCLAAIAATVDAIGISPDVAARGIASLHSVPGRMERIDLGQPFAAIVDFAHTPNALRQALTTARRLCSGRVIAVFGSAGLRDREKRRMMAEVSAELADLTILTAEDPRTEPLEDILEQMAGGARSRGAEEGRTFWRIPDRGQALRFAVGLARPGDLVIACGKGHEQSMCFGETEYPWDDRLALRAALCDLLDIPGPAMPRLPTTP